jgi:hypothetical protein
MALNVMEKVIRVLLNRQHLSPASGAKRNHPGMQFSKRDFVIGEIGETYLFLTLAFRILHTGFFISTYTHHLVTSLFVTPEFLKGSYYTHLSLGEL